MEPFGNYLLVFIENGGLFAPVLFISFHLLRPLFFLPVVFICISGGILFGPAAGTLYSVIGITLSSMMFYGLVHRMPRTFAKFSGLKQRLVGSHAAFTTSQIAILRLVPFIHFHLLSLCLIEISTNFRDYTKSSLLTNIPLAFIYTSVGQWMSQLSPFHTLLFLFALLPFIYFLRRKEMIIKWDDFFQVST
ncbi:TVP38/TMEM64 family protein [Lentibacillus halophilus]|uniref:TVP38/TMEM64 family protein n=1 Tax=Lentibacillus halophilus TaxID=295065 RepID=UPI0031DC9172